VEQELLVVAAGGCRIALSVLYSRLQQLAGRSGSLSSNGGGTVPLKQTHSLGAISFGQQPLSGRINHP
jgi:hypothetical protein